MKRRQKFRLIFAVLACLLYPAVVYADGFTGEQFLKWPRESQDSLIANSIIMTAIVATQGRKDISHCIDNWYSGNEDVQDQRHGYILDLIRKYPQDHPQGLFWQSFNDNAVLLKMDRVSCQGPEQKCSKSFVEVCLRGWHLKACSLWCSQSHPTHFEHHP